MRFIFKAITVSVFLVMAGNGAASNDYYYRVKTSYTDYKAKNTRPCVDGSPWMMAREQGRIAYADRNQHDLSLILVDNKPKLIDTYGKCVEAISMLDKLSALFNPSVYINTVSIKALKELIHERVIDAICTEIQYEAEEVFGEIADIIPLGNYVYHLDDVFSAEVGL